MQSLTWYRYRLGAMTPAEALWRVGQRARASWERAAGTVGPRAGSLARSDPHEKAVDSRCFAGKWARAGDISSSFCDAWRDELVAAAGLILDNKLRLLGSRIRDCGRAIQWNYEYDARRPTPMRASSSIDYRAYDETGDCKWVWELNRHHHLVVLGRAYRATGELRYAECVRSHLASWIDQCPPGLGMNWRSPLEIAIRLINWSWALALIEPSRAVGGPLLDSIASTARLQMRDIARKYSRYSSANNHLIGEAAGVHIAGRCFDPNDTLRLRRRSRDILIREMDAQTYPDGGHRELAQGYHAFVMQFFLLAGLCGRDAGDAFPASYWERLERMFEFAAAMIEGGGRGPMFGDCDDGYVLDLDGGRADARSMLATASVLFDRPDFRRIGGPWNETAYWLLGEAARPAATSLACTEPFRIQSKAFKESGVYLLQCGASPGRRISLTFDCGELGFGRLAAHGHADALNLTLRVDGLDILIDPGTHDYFKHARWRTYFRSTRAHNTVVVDDMDQSQMLGPFLWGRRAEAQCLNWLAGADRTCVAGEHDGYRHLREPVMHRRAVTLHHRRREVRIEDLLAGEGRHRVAIPFHFAPECRVNRVDGQRFIVRRDSVAVEIAFDARMEISEYRGSETPIAGWTSRAYHEREPSTTLIAASPMHGPQTFATSMKVRFATE